MFDGLFCLSRMPLYGLIFKGLELRKAAALLPPKELSEFLCQSNLLKGVAIMGTMPFFFFETVSCYISMGYTSGYCSNTSTAAMNLSFYLAGLTMLSITSKTVLKSVQKETT
ncbi:hypothetical protein TL16_g09469 [Triparma laevis f. inornata]|uniref:Uncharacterized protein n=1 Tax=Triparma laevis f. inornata TaxID=1714386 RepID=A0A9W7B332_9STRA|nr:hypothetical protein TL16_g09469 [Triparma laevis f. inornata]